MNEPLIIKKSVKLMVNWEIRESTALGKGVVAMYKRNTPPSSLPQAIKKYYIRIVSLNKQELAKTI